MLKGISESSLRACRSNVAVRLRCCKPKLIVLDEPVDGLDPVMRRQIWSIMLDDVAANNTTVVVSSHNLRELEDVCDHVGILNKGKIMIERSLTELQVIFQRFRLHVHMACLRYHMILKFFICQI